MKMFLLQTMLRSFRRSMSNSKFQMVLLNKILLQLEFVQIIPSGRFLWIDYYIRNPHILKL